MSRFLKIEGESVWINVDRLDGLMVRPQLLMVGEASGQGSLEELHEHTGRFELVAHFQGHLMTVMTCASREEAEQAAVKLLGSRLADGL